MNTRSSEDTDPAAPDVSLPEKTSSPSCHKCGKSVEESATYCPHCGGKLGTSIAWYYKPVWILILAFFVLGPFALILVWKSPKMGLAVKVMMAILISVYSVYCFYIFYKILAIEMRMINDLNSMMQQLK